MKNFIQLLIIISVLILLLGATYNTITIDGINDFQTDEALSSTGGTFATYFATWDGSYIYLGANNTDVSANSNQKFIYFYIDSDPQINPLNGTGTTVGLQYNTQQPNLPFTANYHFRWRTDNAYMNLQTWNGSTWVDGDQNGILAYQSGNYVEFRIPRANIGSPTQIYLVGAMINEASGGEWTYYITPASGHTDGYDANFVSRYGFTLTSGVSPNDANNVNAALPVELTSFSALKLGDNIKLQWKTATEVNNYGFEVERNGNDGWQKIGFVKGYGNSNSPKDYSFVDEKLDNGNKLQYRLKQIDNDGKYEYSEVVEVSIIPTDFSLGQNYPNPFNPNTSISFNIPQKEFVQLKIYNLIGQEVVRLVNETKTAGRYEVSFDASNFPSGVYIYKLQAGEFVQTKKMILMK